MTAGEIRFALFPSAIGACALAWRGDMVVALLLPEGSEGRTRSRLLSRHPDAVEVEPDQAIGDAIGAIQRLLAGEKADLSFVAVDLAGASDFERDIYRIARTIEVGRTMTYGEVAGAAGHAGSARAAGVALGRNPVPIVIPCHRVLAGGGRSGGFSAPGGVATKFRLLAIERAQPESEAALLFGSLPLAVAPAEKGGASRA